MFTARYGLSLYVLKRQVLSLKNLPGRGLTEVEKNQCRDCVETVYRLCRVCVETV